MRAGVFGSWFDQDKNTKQAVMQETECFVDPKILFHLKSFLINILIIE